jgi:hypothetical protein
MKNLYKIKNDLYVISNTEQIKIDDYITDGYVVWQWKDDSSLLGKKKVILSTDQDLIKDGVQAIDDEFLEWFVGNPTCENIEIEEIHYSDIDRYEIIIPKEEPKCLTKLEIAKNIAAIGIGKEKPKQETLEEAAERLWLNPTSQLTSKKSFIQGAKWQAERMYNEEEVIKIIKSCQNKPIIVENQLTNRRKTSRNWEFDTEYFDKWFEQFKK